MWNESVVLVVIRSGERSWDFQSRSVRNWEEKCNIAPPRGSHGNTNVGEAIFEQ